MGAQKTWRSENMRLVRLAHSAVEETLTEHTLGLPAGRIISYPVDPEAKTELERMTTGCFCSGMTTP